MCYVDNYSPMLLSFEPNLNNLNDDKTFVFLFSATDICFYTAKTCFNILTDRRKMLYNNK